MRHVVWFNVSVMYSSIAAAFISETSGVGRALLVFLTVHGGLWAIYRAIMLARAVEKEENGLPK